jgi:hypothetical protein
MAAAFEDQLLGKPTLIGQSGNVSLLRTYSRAPRVEHGEASLSPQDMRIWRLFHDVIPTTTMLFLWCFEWTVPTLHSAIRLSKRTI